MVTLTLTFFLQIFLFCVVFLTWMTMAFQYGIIVLQLRSKYDFVSLVPIIITVITKLDQFFKVKRRPHRCS